MKTRFIPSLIAGLLLFTAAGLHAQGTAFTYDGKLNDGAGPANGLYDLRFTLYNAVTNGSAASSLTNTATGITNGLFEVVLNFGNVFNGSNYWIELAARTNGATAFTTLSPRQPVLPTPYAIFAANAGSATVAASAGSVAAANITGTLPLAQLPAAVVTNNQAGVTFNGTVTASGFSGGGAGLTGLNASQVTSGTLPLAQLPAGVVTNSGGLPVAQLVTNFTIPTTAENFVAVNPALNKIYLSGGASAAQPIVVVDGVTFGQTSVGNGMGADVDVTNNNYWSGGVYADNVTVWNSSNAALTSVGTGAGCTFETSVDAPHRRVWAGAQCSDSIWVFNADTFAVVSGPISPGGVMGPILVNPATGRLYFSASGSSKRVNPSTFAVTANSFGQVVGVNAVANRIYAMGSGTTLQIINGAPDPEVVLTNVTLPFAVNGGVIGVNPVSNQIYVQQNTNTFAILDGTSGANFGTVTLGTGVTGLGGMAVDVGRNRVYMLAYVGASASLYVYQITPSPALNINGPVTATSFTGSGAGLTNLNASQLTGAISPSQLPPTVVTNNENGVTLSGAFTGNGSGLTNLNLSTATNVALLNAANTFSANQTVNGAVGIGVAASPSTVLHIVSPNANARVLFESSVANGNPALTVKANSPAGEADIVADRADTGASATLQLATGGNPEWAFRTPNFTSGEANRLDLGNTNGTVVMTVRQNGNVGIGKTSPATALDVNGTVTANGFSGNGAGLTNLNVSTVGTNVALLNGTNVFTGTNTFSILAGNGGGLTNLTAANLAGTVADARLSANVPLLNAANTFSANQTVNGAVGIGVAASPSTVLHIVSPNANARVLFESSVANGNPALTVKANSPAGEADIVADRADTGASATHQFATGGNMDWRLGTPNFTSGESYRLEVENSNTTPVMVFHQNGTVGIGKTTAATALDVNGTVTATGFSGNLSGGTNLPLASLQSGGAANAQILTWNGSSWAPSNAPAGGGGSGLATTGGSGTNENFYGTTTFNGPLTATNVTAPATNFWLLGASGGTQGGNVTINSGNAGVPTGGAGGNLNLQAGNAMAAGGSGYTGLGPAGAVNITAGSGYNSVGGNVTIQSGGNSPWTQAGNSFSKVSLQGGTINTGDGGVIDVEGGHNTQYGSPPQYSSGGNVKITGGSATGSYGGGNVVLMPGTGTPNGNVGIGKTNPATALDVNGTVTATGFSGNGTGLTNLNASQMASGAVPDARLSANVALLNAANTFSANQTVNGAVGIGVAASPSTVLHIVSPNANARVLFESSVANGNPALTVKANSPAGEADIVADRADTGASATHQFATGGTMEWRLGTPNFTSGEASRLDVGNASSTPVMVFHQNGTVGIGKTMAATALDVNGTVTATGFSGNGAGVTNINVFTSYSAGAITQGTNFVYPGNFVLNSTPVAGADPSGIAFADFNLDGSVDVACANPGSNTLTVLTNTGGGIFVSNATYTTAVSPLYVVTADVNNDGKPDLIWAGGDNSLNVWTNNGSGRFVAGGSYGLSGTPYQFVAADVNGDGKADLIAPCYNGFVVAVLTNNGNGTFTSAGNISVPTQYPRWVAVADFNGDGKADVAVAEYFSPHALGVYNGNGSGNFTSASTITVGGYAYAVAVADVNGDGKPDLISSGGSGGSLLTVCTNNGNGTFTSAVNYGVGVTPSGLIATDLTGDSKPDLVCVNADNTLSLMTNNGAGIFALGATLGVGTGPAVVSATDVNNDGKLDLISANYGTNTLSVLLNTPNLIPTGSFSGIGSGLVNIPATSIVGGITTNILIGGHTFYITNGIIMNLQ